MKNLKNLTNTALGIATAAASFGTFRAMDKEREKQSHAAAKQPIQNFQPKPYAPK